MAPPSFLLLDALRDDAYDPAIERTEFHFDSPGFGAGIRSNTRRSSDRKKKAPPMTDRAQVLHRAGHGVDA
jgi:hypothetical protein